MPRAVSEDFIAGLAAISVGYDGRAAPPGWTWTKLTDVARLESGHTPSRKKASYWNGRIPWLSIPDARDHHGRTIMTTESMITDDGVANSSARVLPKDTICLCRTSYSLGYVTRLGRPIATSQDFVNWVCGPLLDPGFLMYALMAEGRHIRAFAKGTTHPTIYFPEALGFYIALPSRDEQSRIVSQLQALLADVGDVNARLEKAPTLLTRFRQSVLAAACSGKLTEEWRDANEPVSIEETIASVSVRESKTGRAATDDVIPGKAILSVGLPEKDSPPGWKWVSLTSVAKLESGHTPSRKHPEYWNGKIGWIGLTDAAAHHGGVIDETAQTITAAGIENSAARLLPAGTVCLSRTASIGYVVIMGKAMTTSQDFVNWVCSPAVVPEFLAHALLAEGADIKRFGRGTTHATIYFPEVKALHICLPPVEEQREIVRRIRDLLPVADIILGAVENAAQRSERLAQAVLLHALRGGLRKAVHESRISRRERVTSRDAAGSTRDPGPVRRQA